MGFLSSIFKKKQKEETVKGPSAAANVDPEPVSISVPERDGSDTRTKITVRRDPVKKEPSKTVKKEAPKKGSAKGTSSKQTAAKKEGSKDTPRTVKKDEPRNAAAKKSASKKVASKSVSSNDEKVPGTRPVELKGLEKELKGYAQRSRMTYDPTTANKVFTEYMARIFRDRGYRMVILRDGDGGELTMLDNGNDESVRDKILVKCLYMKEGSVGTASITAALKEGAEIHADQIWCVTTTDFNEGAVRKSRKEGVTLYDGRRLHQEFLQVMDGTLWD